MTTSKGGRKATGSVRIMRTKTAPYRKQWHARFTYESGERSDFLPLDPSIPVDDEEQAKSYAANIADRIIREGYVPHANGKTANGTGTVQFRGNPPRWFTRFCVKDDNGTVRRPWVDLERPDLKNDEAGRIAAKLAASDLENKPNQYNAPDVIKLLRRICVALEKIAGEAEADREARRLERKYEKENPNLQVENEPKF